MLRLSGEQAINIARKMSPTIDTWEHSRAVVGHLYRSDGQVLDQAVITTFYAPRSFTGEHTVEFSCHGNPLIVDAIVNLAIEYGARLANPGEFTRQAVLNGKMTMLKAEALNEVIHAASLEGVGIAQRGLSGLIDQNEERLRHQLLEIAAELEAKMDYPQEDLSFESDEDIVATLYEIADQCKRAAQSYQQNRIRLHGAKVAILGPVNAGKSSLFNHLVGSKRAIVSDRPGTTRDIVERRVLIDGMEICFFDTAGARFDSDDPIENEGIQMGLEIAKEADLCLLVHPATSELGVVLQLQQEIGNIPSILVATHSDMVDMVLFDADVVVSNTDITGILELKNKILTVLGFNNTSESKHVSLSQRQQSLFVNIADHVHVAAEALSGFLGPAVATEEITLALEALANLRGDDARESILDQLFSKFCVGK
jgi:tRNA modification GTPase